jgi:hypothetical protein
MMGHSVCSVGLVHPFSGLQSLPCDSIHQLRVKDAKHGFCLDRGKPAENTLQSMILKLIRYHQYERELQTCLLFTGLSSRAEKQNYGCFSSVIFVHLVQ